MGDEKCPSNHLLIAVLATLLCCLPFGIVSIVYAVKVDTAWRDGFPEMARSYSRKARNWALWGAGIVIIFYLLCLLVYVFAIAVGMDWMDVAEQFA